MYMTKQQGPKSEISPSATGQRMEKLFNKKLSKMEKLTYQPIYIRGVNQFNSLMLISDYGYVGFGIFKYIEHALESAKRQEQMLVIDSTFIQVMDGHGFDMGIMYDLLFAHHYFDIIDHDCLQIKLFKMVQEKTDQFPMYFP